MEKLNTYITFLTFTFFLIFSQLSAQIIISETAGTTTTLSIAGGEVFAEPNNGTTGGLGGDCSTSDSGNLGDYPNCNCITITTLTAPTGQQVSVAFTQFRVFGNFDWLAIFDGDSMVAATNGSGSATNPTSSDPLLWNSSVNGDELADIQSTGSVNFTSTNGSLTFASRFSGVVNTCGWEAQVILCIDGVDCPCSPVSGTAVISTVDQLAGTFTIDVDITNIENDSIVIANDGGVAPTTVTNNGVTNVGPFSIFDTIIISLEHPIDSCSISLPPLFTNPSFITEWEVTANDQISIPLQSGTYDFNYVWASMNDSLFQIAGVHTNSDGDFITDFVDAGTYTLEITGDFPHLKDYPVAKLKDVLQWGSLQWATMESMFRNWLEDEFSAVDAPNLSNVFSMNNMFRDATFFNDDLDNWNVSNVTSFTNMFVDAEAFNGNIINWDVSNATSLRSMFNQAESFNQDISDWDVSNVNTMFLTFAAARSFNQPIGKWDISNVTNMERMLSGALVFNQPLGSWQFNPALRNGQNNRTFSMLNNTNLDCQNWSTTILGWNFSNPSLDSMIIQGPIFEYDSIASIARDELVARAWNINGTDIGGDCGGVFQFPCNNTLTIQNDTLYGNLIIRAQQFIELNNVTFQLPGNILIQAPEVELDSLTNSVLGIEVDILPVAGCP